MTPDARSFDLYLLSCMRAAAQVDAALAQMGASRAEMAKALAAVEAAGLADLVVSAQCFVDVLGAPDREDPAQPDRADFRFGGARRLRFRRPPWPAFDFTAGVNEEGQPWGLGFLRGHGVPVPRLNSAADLAPWRFVRPEVVARFGAPRTEDAWSGWEELSFEIPDHPTGPGRRYLLRFDHDLLQEHRLLG